METMEEELFDLVDRFPPVYNGSSTEEWERFVQEYLEVFMNEIIPKIERLRAAQKKGEIRLDCEELGVITNRWASIGQEYVDAAPEYISLSEEGRQLFDTLKKNNIAKGLLNEERKYWSIDRAQRYVKRKGFGKKEEFLKWTKTGFCPLQFIRGNPQDYEDFKTQKVSWAMFLGYSNEKSRTLDRCVRYRSFRDAQKFVKQLKLKGFTEWVTWCNSGERPSDIPANAQLVYDENLDPWTWGEFLGTGAPGKHRHYVSEEEAKLIARQFIRVENVRVIGNQRKKLFSKYIQENKLDVPADFYRYYGIKDENDFFGTKRRVPKASSRVRAGPKSDEDFEEARNLARKYAKKYGLTKEHEYHAFIDKHPEIQLPKHPQDVFPQFQSSSSMSDWLGVKIGYKGKGKQKYLPFEEAREHMIHFAKKHNVSKASQLFLAFKEKGRELPHDVPTYQAPRIYKEKVSGGFTWGFYAGYKEAKQQRSLKEIMEFVQPLRFKNRAEFGDWAAGKLDTSFKRPVKPSWVPSNPDRGYLAQDFKALAPKKYRWPTFLGYEPLRKEVLPYEEAQKTAREFAQKHPEVRFVEKIWQDWFTAKKLPKGLPGNLFSRYAEYPEWKGHIHFVYGEDKSRKKGKRKLHTVVEANIKKRKQTANTTK